MLTAVSNSLRMERRYNSTLDLCKSNYDGRGIVVQAYVAKDCGFQRHKALVISPDLVEPLYDNASFIFTLPDTTSLDDFNSISICCVDVDVDVRLGDGVFE